MTSASEGALPRGGFAPIVCELLVDDIDASLAFWTGLLGFDVAYSRAGQGFVYLQRPEGGQIMLCQRAGVWETGAMQRPFGRGIMFQLHVRDLSELEDRLVRHDWPLLEGRREVWRRYGDREGGRREIVVQDPDGYLVMIAEHIGERPLG